MKLELNVPKKVIHATVLLTIFLIVIGGVYATWSTPSPTVWHTADQIKVALNTSYSYALSEIINTNSIIFPTTDMTLNPKGTGMGKVIIPSNDLFCFDHSCIREWNDVAKHGIYRCDVYYNGNYGAVNFKYSGYVCKIDLDTDKDKIILMCDEGDIAIAGGVECLSGKRIEASNRAFDHPNWWASNCLGRIVTSSVTCMKT